jgi:large repetitive protein
LVFDVGTIPANSSIVLTYKMKLGDAVEAGDAKNCVAASGVNTVTNGDKESGQACATVVIKTGLFLEKRVNVTKAELGDSVEYSLRVKSVGGTTKNVTISDNLPLGFKLIAGTVKVVRAGVTSSMADPAGSPGPALTFNVGTVANKEVVEIRYRVRLGIGSDIGDGINKAQAKAPFATSSLVATAKVTVTRGVFTREACIAGKVFMDCNQNKVQDKGELAIPGVRLYMEDGTNITTDENGQYSICGVRAISHVMVVDITTMPIGSRMGITSNKNLGSGETMLLNIKAGELYRADFIESSCFPKILDQVEQRRKNSAGVVNVPLVQTGQDKPGIVFDAKEQELLAPALRGVK